MTYLTQSFPTKSRMKNDCGLLEFDLKDEQAELLMEYADILSRRSLETNLIGPLEINRLWRRHILESISYIPLLEWNHKVVDIGSGAGFPGLVLGILGMDMTLLEPRRKRHQFLSDVIKQLGLADTEAIPVRMENVNPDILGNQFVARTVAPPEVLLSMIRKKTDEKSILVYRIPPDKELIKGNKYINLHCPPLDRPGFLVQYRTCS